MTRKIVVGIWAGEEHLGDVTADFVDDTMTDGEMLEYTRNLLKKELGESAAVTVKVKLVKRSE